MDPEIGQDAEQFVPIVNDLHVTYRNGHGRPRWISTTPLHVHRLSGEGTLVQYDRLELIKPYACVYIRLDKFNVGIMGLSL